MNNLVKIFNCADQPEVQEWVTRILAKSSENHREQAINNLFNETFLKILQPLSCLAGNTAIGYLASPEIRVRSNTGALRWLCSRTLYPKVRDSSYSLMKAVISDAIGKSCEECLDENALSALEEMAQEKEQDWVTDGAFAMFKTILSHGEHCI